MYFLYVSVSAAHDRAVHSRRSVVEESATEVSVILKWTWHFRVALSCLRHAAELPEVKVHATELGLAAEPLACSGPHTADGLAVVLVVPASLDGGEVGAA
jgi:hypothetical protein